MKITEKVYDVGIIGAGVVGAAIACELAQYDLNSVLVEAESDVGMGTSKANTAIWHTGFDAKPGSLEAKLLRRSYRLLEEFVPQANIPHERTGAVLVAWSKEQFDELPHILEKAHKNGVTDVRQLAIDEIYQLEPHLNAGALGGLMVPGEFIICTFSLPLAFATQAVLNGTNLRLDFPVETIEANKEYHILISPSGKIKCRYVINAAGLYSDEIDRLFGFSRFTVTPRRGELIVFDKLACNLIHHVLLPIPTGKTKGVLVSPTVYGNIMLGPTAEDLHDKKQKGTSREGIEFLWQKGQAIIDKLMSEEVTATYAGLRAATEHSDYQIFSHPEQRYVCVGGIRSTGLSASMGIAEYVGELLQDAGLKLQRKPEFKAVKMPPIGERMVRPFQSPEVIEANPDYGRIVCNCEKVSLGEIKDAVHAPIPARSLEGIRRRTRSMQGRCQGFHCQADVSHFLTEELRDDQSVTMDREADHE